MTNVYDAGESGNCVVRECPDELLNVFSAFQQCGGRGGLVRRWSGADGER